MIKQLVLFCCMLGGVLNADSNFVIKKDKRHKTPSMNTVKEQYARDAGELIKMVPKVEKHLVGIHGRIISDLDDLLNNASDSQLALLSKEQLQERSKKIVLLTQQLEKLDEQLKTIKQSLSSTVAN